MTPEAWSAVLAEALDEAAARVPPGRWSTAEASAVQQLRGAAELKAAVDSTVKVFSGHDLSWTVVLDSEGALGPPCLARTVRVSCGSPHKGTLSFATPARRCWVWK